MEYAIFPMETINISQRHDGATSHGWDGTNGCKAIDLGGAVYSDGKTYEDVYAPTTMKVLWIDTPSNIVAFGTCDNHGNPQKVKCENIEDQILTFAFIHASDDALTELGIKEGKIFNSGEICYREGTKANNDSNGADIHIHVEVAKGWAKKTDREYSKGNARYGATRFINSISLFPHDIFYRLKGWNVVGTGSGLNGYTMKEVISRTVEGTVTPPSNELSGCYLNATKSAFRVRWKPVNGTQVALVPVGGRARVLNFLGIQSDNYQWAEVSYEIDGKCSWGYSQIDALNCYTLSGACSKTLYLYATKLGFNVRASAPSGAVKIFCPKGSKAKILYFGNIVNNGYQWAYVEYNGVQGWAQMDTKNCYTVNV